MHTRALGDRLSLTELGLGGSQFGNLSREMDDATAAATFEAAWTAGLRYVDTAPHYGLGLSERRIGRLLDAHPRDSYVLSSKVGRRIVPAHDGALKHDDEGFAVRTATRRQWDFSRDGVLRSVEESLARLGLDRLDIALLHDAEQHWDQAVTEALPALVELRDQGVVTAIGAGMNHEAPLRELVDHHDVDVVMCAGRHTLLEDGRQLLDAALEHGVAVVIAGVYNSGLLARPRPEAGASYDYRTADAALVERARAIADICDQHDTSLPAVALRHPLRHPAVASVVVGAHDADQVAAAVRGYEDSIPQQLWTELADSGLVAV